MPPDPPPEEPPPVEPALPVLYLYLVIDQTWWTFRQPMAGGGTFGPILIEGVKKFVATAPDVSMALQFAPIPGGAYLVPAVPLGPLNETAHQEAIVGALESHRAGTQAMADALAGALRVGALPYLASYTVDDVPIAPERTAIVLATRFASASGSLLFNTVAGVTNPVFVLSTPSGPRQDGPLIALARAQRPEATPYWTMTADEVAAALAAITARSA